MADHSEPQLNLLLADDKETMHLTVNGDGKLLAGIVLSAGQLDQVIAGLLTMRAHMTPPFPAKLGDCGEARSIKGTHFDFSVGEASRELIFSLRDPELGWLSQRFGVRLLERMLSVARSFESGREQKSGN
jgi:hypothetical protein